MKKKVFSIITILALCLTLLPGTALAVEAAETETLISTSGELKDFRNAVNGGDSFYGKIVKLTADIDLNGSADDPWTPIGSGRVFEGTFDGQGHTISGLYAADDTADSIALFGVAWGAEIKNVKLANSTLIGNNYVGGIVSHSQKRTASGVDTYPQITNCTVEDTVTITGNRTTGGIAGQFNGTIENCVNNARITVTNKGADGNNNKDLCGGIVGYLNVGEGAILNCVNNGDVTGIYTVGGIAGDSNGKIENCTNNGIITAQCDTDNSNFSMVGGIVGNLTGAEEYAWCTGELINCLNTGDVTATGLVVGGVAGYADGAPLSNVINQGNVEGSAYVGGLVGLAYETDVIGGYSLGAVNASSAAGGIVGHSSSANRDFSDLYFNSDAFQGDAISNGAGVITRAESKPLSAFASGEVAQLLRDAGETQAWGQSLSGDNADAYPVLTDDAAKRVCKVTFKIQSDEGDTDYAVVYANPTGVGADRMPEAPTSETERFAKWSADPSGSGEFTASTAISQDITIYAQWTENSSPVTPAEPDAPDDPSAWENPFTDVKVNDWYYEAVEFANENGLFYGMTDTTFSPNGDMTRGMLAAVLYRLAEEPETAANDLFSDVADGRYYTEAVAWAAENEIVAGYGNGKYGPEDFITREQLAAILWRYAGSPESAGSLDSFTDGAKTSGWAVPALQWAVEQKIVSGKGNGILDPRGKATRAEVAAMLMRYSVFAGQQ